MKIAERRVVNSAMVEVKPGVEVRLCDAMVMVASIRKDSKNVKKTDLTEAAQAYWLD